MWYWNARLLRKYVKTYINVILIDMFIKWVNEKNKI
jgi:hypothetical protein